MYTSASKNRSYESRGRAPTDLFTGAYADSTASQTKLFSSSYHDIVLPHHSHHLNLRRDLIRLEKATPLRAYKGFNIQEPHPYCANQCDVRNSVSLQIITSCYIWASASSNRILNWLRRNSIDYMRPIGKKYTSDGRMQCMRYALGNLTYRSSSETDSASCVCNPLLCKQKRRHSPPCQLRWYRISPRPVLTGCRTMNCALKEHSVGFYRFN